MSESIELELKTKHLLKASRVITDLFQKRRVIKFTPVLLLDIHKEVFGYDPYHAGEFRDNRIRIKTEGATFKAAPAHLINIKIQTLCDQLNSPRLLRPEYRKLIVSRLSWYSSLKESTKETLFVLFVAARAHHTFVEIHPFAGGNGRMARLIVSIILGNFGHSILQLPPMLNEVILRRREEYLNALHKADNGNILYFVEFLAEVLKESYEKTTEILKTNS